jgi:Glycosyl hydrolase family 47
MDSFCATGATVIDSLSTLWLADMPERFARARAWVAEKDFSTLRGCNLFESNIRVVGGLLSAGALSGDSMFFEKAEQVARMMMPSFDTPAGIPCNSFPGGGGCGSANLAEAGTLVLEWTYLSQVTKNDEYQKMAERTMRSIMTGRNNSDCMPGIYSKTVSTADGRALEQCWASMGGGADSMYEYLLKLWLMTRQAPSFQPYKRAWDLSMSTYTSRFLRCSDRGHLYIAAGNAGHANQETEHLACFLGGNLLLGNAAYLKLAAGVTESCVAMYTSTTSRLGSDGVSWQGSHPVEKCGSSPKGHEGADILQRSPSNLQRPETVESLFFLWRKTRDPRYRELGWIIMKELNQTRVASGGFASVHNVYTSPVAGQLADKQESFFIAEELKYLLLLFQEDSSMAITPEDWVFNTEAHPLPKFTPLFPSSIGDVCEGAPNVC